MGATATETEFLTLMTTHVMESTLADLATEINAEYDLAFGKAKEALEHVRRCGELLIEAKGKMPHGKWVTWLGENCDVCRRQVQRYMKLAANWTRSAIATTLPE